MATTHDESAGTAHHGFVTWARTIADELVSDSMAAPDGSPTWGRGFDREFRPVPDAGVFNGRVGEALLFGTLARHGRRPDLGEMALRIVDPLRRRLREPSQARAFADDIGLGVTGLGTVLYAFARLADLLDEPSLRRDLDHIIGNIDTDIFARAKQCDFYWGTPGLVLALTAIVRAGVEAALPLACAAAHHLMTLRMRDPHSGCLAWPTTDDLPTGGFAHGNSGVASALFALVALSPNDRWRDAAMEAIRFERSLFLDEVGDWLDYHGQNGPLMSSWCHGAPGIIHARLAALPHIRAEEEETMVFEDLRTALERTARYPQEGVHTICCGILGRADGLLEAGLRLPNPSLVAGATLLAENAVAFAERRGGFLVSRANESHKETGMWQGRTGIAYQLLRMSAPANIPSVLILG